MRLFSEKVQPTFTSSDLNILTVESFEEVFFVDPKCVCRTTSKHFAYLTVDKKDANCEINK